MPPKQISRKRTPHVVSIFSCMYNLGQVTGKLLHSVSKSAATKLNSSGISNIALGPFGKPSLNVHCLLQLKRLLIATMPKSRRNKLKYLLS